MSLEVTVDISGWVSSRFQLHPEKSQPRNLHLARLSFYVEPFRPQESWQKKSLTAEKPQHVVRKMAGAKVVSDVDDLLIQLMPGIIVSLS